MGGVPSSRVKSISHLEQVYPDARSIDAVRQEKEADVQRDSFDFLAVADIAES